MRNSYLAIVAIFILLLSACSESASDVPDEPVLDVEQFSLVNQTFVKEKLGEPNSIDTWSHQTPSTGANNALTTLDYDWDGYYSEFHFDDKDRLIRINIYSSDNENSEFKKTTFENLLKQLHITTGKNLTKVADTGVAWRYERVSEKVDEVWAIGNTNNDGFDVIKVSFDVRPFK
ncbi:hypothetical protein FQ087_18520 [Sporosarcina sp. ANT_H38]|uniref:hypothetical protein n=1 Tax=Sporosarcina sp. ANT_H38 TaxID=2597358 RepID=UPI0011F0B258|nr:hypothetical protein [Sporosarcina sp. ANT_H38]KAA0944120.1 hypothetical protein FQ087_18520 [Sporosarcina sp. ANT_H38]